MGLFDTPEIKEAKRLYKEETKRLIKNLKPTGKIFMCAKWDDNLEVIYIYTSATIVKYNSIKNIQIIENVKAVTETKGKSKKKGGITRALAGGFLAGPAGAIVGGMTAKTEHKSTSITQQKVTKTIVLTRDDPFRTILNIPYNAELEAKLRSVLECNTTDNNQLEKIEMSVPSDIDKLKEYKGHL